MFYFKKIFLIIFLIILLIYVSNITNIPDQVLLFYGENLNIRTVFGINIEKQESYEVVQTSANVKNDAGVKKKVANVNLFNFLKIKEIEVGEIPNATIIPLGNTIGLKLYTNGVLVIGMTEIEGKKPYKDTNIKEGDLIIAVNSIDINTTSDLVECVKQSNGEKMEIKYIRDGNECVTTIQPVHTQKNEYKIGLWVRDGAVRSRNHNIL